MLHSSPSSTPWGARALRLPEKRSFIPRESRPHWFFSRPSLFSDAENPKSHSSCLGQQGWILCYLILNSAASS